MERQAWGSTRTPHGRPEAREDDRERPGRAARLGANRVPPTITDEEYHFRQRLGSYGLPNRGRGSIAIMHMPSPSGGYSPTGYSPTISQASRSGEHLNNAYAATRQPRPATATRRDAGMSNSLIPSPRQQRPMSSSLDGARRTTMDLAMPDYIVRMKQQADELRADLAAKLSSSADAFFATETAKMQASTAIIPSPQTSEPSTIQTHQTKISEPSVAVLDLSSVIWSVCVIVAIREAKQECDVLPTTSTEIESMLVQTVPFDHLRRQRAVRSIAAGESLDVFNPVTKTWATGFVAASPADTGAFFVHICSPSKPAERVMVSKQLLRPTNYRHLTDTDIGSSIEVMDSAGLRWQSGYDLHERIGVQASADPDQRLGISVCIPASKGESLQSVASYYGLPVGQVAQLDAFIVPAMFVRSPADGPSLYRDKGPTKECQLVASVGGAEVAATPISAQPSQESVSIIKKQDAPFPRDVKPYETSRWVSPEERAVTATEFAVRSDILNFVNKIKDGRKERQTKLANIMEVSSSAAVVGRSGRGARSLYFDKTNRPRSDIAGRAEMAASHLPSNSAKRELYTIENTHIQNLRRKQNRLSAEDQNCWDISTALPHRRRRTLRHTMLDEQHADQHSYHPHRSFNPMPLSVYRKVSPEKKYGSAVAARLSKMEVRAQESDLIAEQMHYSSTSSESIMGELGLGKQSWR